MSKTVQMEWMKFYVNDWLNSENIAMMSEKKQLQLQLQLLQQP